MPERARQTRRLPAAHMDAAQPGHGALLQHSLWYLQRQVGNQAVAGMLAQRQAEEDEELQAKHDPVLQRRPEDEEEEEEEPVGWKTGGADAEAQAGSPLLSAHRAGWQSSGKKDPDLTLEVGNPLLSGHRLGGHRHPDRSARLHAQLRSSQPPCLPLKQAAQSAAGWATAISAGPADQAARISPSW